MEQDYTIFDLIDSWEEDLNAVEETTISESTNQIEPSRQSILNILSYAAGIITYSPTLKKHIKLKWN